MSEEENVDTTEQAAEDNSSTLEAKVDAKLAAMGQETTDAEVTEDADEQNKDTETNDDTTQEAAESGSENSDDSPILPAGHRRAALADGWTSEEIDYYLETQPEAAMEKFESAYNDWREENSQWSARGRQLKAAEQSNTDVDPQSNTTEELKPLEKFDAKALIEEHGNDELIAALTTPMNNMVDQINSVLGKVSASQEFVQESTEETISNIVQDFLTSKDMEPFAGTYGKDLAKLTDAQEQKRMELFSEADDIVFGATAHGKQITVAEALRRAHANVSEGQKDAAIRDSIRKDMKKRTKTLSGSKQKTTSTDNSAPLTREELVARTNERLRAMHQS